MKKETSTMITMVVSEEEMQEIIKMREQKEKEQQIETKAAQITDLINEIRELGGYVRIDRNGDNRYLSKAGERLSGIRYRGSYVEFLC